MGNPHVFYRLGILSEDTLERVIDEANVAHDKHGSQSMLYGSDDKSLRILLEEVGELAREMNELALDNREVGQYNKNMQIELEQVAAMAITWLEKKRGQL